MKKRFYWILIWSMSMCACGTGSGLEARLEKAVAGYDAQVGIALIINGRDTVTVNNSDDYPLMSVMKLHQAMAVADSLARLSGLDEPNTGVLSKSGKTKPSDILSPENGLSLLDTLLYIRREDLKPNTYSPLRDRLPEGNFYISVRELLGYTLQLSDNNACDILFTHFGGPSATQEYLRSIGISHCNVVCTEDDMHRDLNLCYANSTSPLSAAELMEKLYRHQTLPGPRMDIVIDLIENCQTGRDRIPAPFLRAQESAQAVGSPTSAESSGTGISATRIGHKTGTGDRNADGRQIGCNDLAFITFPDGQSYSLAVFVKDSAEPDSTNNAIIAEISAIVLDYFMDR